MKNLCLVILSSLFCEGLAELVEIKLVGNCEVLPPDLPRDEIWRKILAKFDDQVPGAKDVAPGQSTTGAARFLRGVDEDNRELGVTQCPVDCSKPKNWTYCIKQGCKCTCGGRRLTSSDAVDLDAVQKQMTGIINSYSSKYGCPLGVLLTQII